LENTKHNILQISHSFIISMKGAI